MYQRDWLSRQIESMVQFAAQILFDKDSPFHYEDTETMVIQCLSASADDPLHIALMRLLSEDKLCEAEDCLFANFDEQSVSHLKTAVDFYRRLNELSDEYLEEHNFLREEIDEGLRDILSKGGIEIGI